MPVPLISKSSFIRARQCHKSLWLHLNQPEERDETSALQQRIFDTGHSVGAYAQQLFPGGIDASRGAHDRVADALTYTQELITGGQAVIYEAAFSDGETLCYMDILVKENGLWRAYEVKASTGVKEYQVMDVAYQYYVITRSGLPLADIYLVHINNQYIRRGPIDVQQLFTKVCMSPAILPLQESIPSSLGSIFEMLSDPEAPAIEMGYQCTHPYDCDFMEFCRSQLPTDPASSIQDPASRNDEALREFTSQLIYPLHFLDFETFFPAIPLHDESRPYQQIPFQYSLHRVEDGELARLRVGEMVSLRDGELRKDRSTAKDAINTRNFANSPSHYSFLGTPTDDPRPAFIESLISNLGSVGSILVWNKTFECTRLKEIARDFPAYREPIDRVLERIVDLMVPFRRRHLYTPEMNGSYSLKAVLPALVPELSYNDLEIQEGGTASETYASLYIDNDPESVARKRENLLRYCELDTLSMVRILELL